MSLVRTSGGVVLASSVAILPVMLVGALAFLLQEELSFGEAQLGIAVATYSASGALIATPAGRLTERYGPRQTAWLGLCFSFVSLLGIALIARSWASLVVFLGFGGIATTIVQIGVNVLLARRVSADRQGVVFGIAQGAIPLAALLAGISVPTIGLTLGWRWAFIAAAAMTPIAAAVIARGDERPSEDHDTRESDAPFPELLLLAIGVALAVAGGMAGAAFIVSSSVERGLTPADAGLVLAAGSLVVVVVRVVVGWLGDRLGHGYLLIVTSLISVGVVGYLGLAFVEPPLLVLLCTTLAFGGGWGWTGLLLLAVVRANPVAPGNAMGFVYTGFMAGSVLGPLVFGVVAEDVAFSAAWLLMAAMALVGMVSMLLARRRILRVRPGLSRRW